MATHLETLCNDIKDIRVYLIKIGPSRRTEKILIKKLSEANDIFMRYSDYVAQIIGDIQKGKVSSSESELIYKYIERFQSLYAEVIELCKSSKTETMSTFDLKVALNLLPLMTDEEANTRQLIDNIEYYSSTLSTPDCKKELVNFVLKSRLSQAAKLRLCPKYSSVDDLVIDMKKVLLPQRSATALQTKLTSMRQNELSLQDYAKEISELFVQLTVSQANGQSENYNILKPLNEQYAIKKFADGLRNRRLSTIIAARNYSSLKDAIQAAQDEEIASSPSSAEVLGMYNNNVRFSRSFRQNRGYRGHRGDVNQRHSHRRPYREGYHNNNGSRGGWNGHRYHQHEQAPARNRQGYRGKSYYNRNQRMRNNDPNKVNVITEPEVNIESANTSNSDNNKKFFRN